MSYRDDDTYFEDVDRALKKKYLKEEDFERRNPDKSLKQGKSYDYSRYLSAEYGTVSDRKVNDDEYSHDDEYYKRIKKRRLLEKKLAAKKKRRKKIIAFLASVLVVLIGTFVFFRYTESGQNIIIKSATMYAEKKMNTDYTVKFNPPETIPEGWVYDSNVVNVLLVGIEHNEGASNTDSMILVSENLNTGKITMVSLLRDTYVKIDGQDKYRKLNYAYSHGNGIQTLINTIQNTYHIFINAYASVSYDDFENVIDSLGGVNLEISSREAEYLNTTNYISDPLNRNLTAGNVSMNGNQALGFCRIRKVPTFDGITDDYGRTLRQRRVINSVFESYKDQSLPNMIKTTNNVLGSITTNISADNMAGMLSAYNKHHTDSMESMMIPAEGLFTPVSVNGVGEVLSIEGYEEQNIETLHEALYGM